MNREALPLIIAIIIPIILVSSIILYIYGYDITYYFKQIEPIYYVILLPFALGALAALVKLRKPKY